MFVTVAVVNPPGVQQAGAMACEFNRREGELQVPETLCDLNMEGGAFYLKHMGE